MSETDGRHEIIPSRTPPEQTAGYLQVVPNGSTRPVFWTNLPNADRRQRAVITRCLANPSLDQEKVIGASFKLAGVLFQAVKLVDRETGEIAEKVRTVLVRDDGQTVAFVSEGIFKGLCLILMLEGAQTWEEPIEILIHKVKLQGGGHTFNVEMLAPGDASEPEGRKRRGS